MSKTNTKMPLSGRNIFVDKKGRTVYYKRSTKQGFVINQDLENPFKTFSKRFVLGFLAFVLVHVLFLEGTGNIFIGLGVGIAVYAFAEYKYRKVLELCPMIQNFDYENAKPSTILTSDISKGNIILRTLLYIALGGLLIANAHLTPYIANDMMLLIASYIAAFFAFYMAAKFLIALTKK